MRKRIIIRDRLKRSFLYVALIPAILFLTAFGIYAGVNTWKQSTENLTKQMSRAQQELNQLLEEAAQVARTVADDRQIIEAMSENYHRDRDRFLSEIIPFANKGVGFIDKQNTAHGLVDLLLGLHGSLTDITGYQTGTVNLHKLSFG